MYATINGVEILKSRIKAYRQALIKYNDDPVVTKRIKKYINQANQKLRIAQKLQQKAQQLEKEIVVKQKELDKADRELKKAKSRFHAVEKRIFDIANNRELPTIL